MHRRSRAWTGTGMALAAAAALGCPEPGDLERQWPAFGTQASVRIHAVDQPTAERVAEEIRSAFARVDSWVGSDNPDALLRRIQEDAVAGPVRITEPDVYRLLKLAREYARSTAGAYDPTIGVVTRLAPARDPAAITAALAHVGWAKFELLPEHRALRLLDREVVLDLSGIERGFALEVAGRSFAHAGVSGGTIALGDDVYAWGAPPGADVWVVPLRWTGSGLDDVGTLALRDRYVSTLVRKGSDGLSGAPEHAAVLDPATGRAAASDVGAVSVVADRGSMAEAVARAILVAGSLRIESILDADPRLEALVLVDTPRGPVVLASASLRERIAFRPELVDGVAGRVRYHLPPERVDSGLLRR